MDDPFTQYSAQRQLRLKKHQNIIQKKNSEQKYVHEVESLQPKSLNAPRSPIPASKIPNRTTGKFVSENFADIGPQALCLSNPDILDSLTQVLQLGIDKDNNDSPTVAAVPESCSKEQLDIPNIHQAMHLPPIRPVKLQLAKTPQMEADKKFLFESMETEENAATVKKKTKVEKQKARIDECRHTTKPVRPKSAAEPIQRPQIHYEVISVLDLETSVASSTEVRPIKSSSAKGVSSQQKRKRVRKRGDASSFEMAADKGTVNVSQNFSQMRQHSQLRFPLRPTSSRGDAAVSHPREELVITEDGKAAKHLIGHPEPSMLTDKIKIKKADIMRKKRSPLPEDESFHDEAMKSAITRIFSAGEDVKEFISSLASKDVTVCCRITRHKHGLEGGLYPSYFLHLERNEDGRRFFLMAARRKLRATTCKYIISLDATATSSPFNAPGDSRLIIGHLRSNFLGTQFSLLSNHSSYNDLRSATDNSDIDLDSGNWSKEIASIVYEPNILGFKGPRKMLVRLPPPIQHYNSRSTNELCRRGKYSEIVELRNKKPMWDEKTQSNILDFHGRVTQASVKNFQLVDLNNQSTILMQFGRISSDTFTMDYTYPLTALQAFGIGISSLVGKLACE